MAQKITERIQWAVETMAVAPDERILEIGCGHGVAVSLICEKLASGQITAIDRSQAMIEMAQRRSHAFVSVGKARFCCAALEDADLGDARFDRIFAIRVNFFIQQPARQLAKIKELLAPVGALYLFHDAPSAAQLAPFLDTAMNSLHTYGFTVEQASQNGQGVCIMAKVA
jgi:ubiquinone/menaquinone biosynthesis C-methylase UbiE